jgi:predicted PurR-regulated permease PerM
VRSYTLIILVAFAQVFAGLLILSVEGAFAIAIICAFVDALPILGVGVVLVPWSIVSFVIGNQRLGIGLLILFTIIYIVRQIIEPRIVSSQMNVHPLVAIISMYAGLKIAGVGGMIVAPFLAFGAKTVYEGLKKDDETKKCVENGESL